jgi:hypothetical protein
MKVILALIPKVFRLLIADFKIIKIIKMVIIKTSKVKICKLKNRGDFQNKIKGKIPKNKIRSLKKLKLLKNILVTAGEACAIASRERYRYMPCWTHRIAEQ